MTHFKNLSKIGRTTTKLRNKKTGEIGKLHCDMNISPAKYGVFEDTDIRGHYWEYDSLAELCGEEEE